MNSSNSSNEILGNNEPKSKSRAQCSAAKNYVFVKYPGNDPQIEPEFRKSLETICQEYQYSHEFCPTTGRLHYQGQMILTTKMRKTQIVKFKHLNMDLRVQKGTQHHQDVYISKNTMNHHKWIKPREDKSHEFRKHLWNCDLGICIETYKELISKNFKDKPQQTYMTQCIPIMVQVGEINNTPIKGAIIQMCCEMLEFNQELKQARDLVDKYIK